MIIAERFLNSASYRAPVLSNSRLRKQAGEQKDKMVYIHSWEKVLSYASGTSYAGALRFCSITLSTCATIWYMYVNTAVHIPMYRYMYSSYRAFQRPSYWLKFRIEFSALIG